MNNLEKYIHVQRLNKKFRLCILLGEKTLEVLPNNNRIKEEMSISYYWLSKSKECQEFTSIADVETIRAEKIKNIKQSLNFVNQIISDKPTDKDLFIRSIFNHQLYIERLESLINYNDYTNVLTRLPVISSLPLVTFSITTCRRPDLFNITMAAFMENFEDINLISRWICVDDNSSQTDREEMKKKWPFFEFVWKTESQKGHPESMKIITKMVTTPYLLHIEDDRMLIDKRQYIQDMIDILEFDTSLGQVVFNKNYKEIATDDIRGGVEKTTKKNTVYYEHEYCKTNKERLDFQTRNGKSGLNCNYYPHFSLSPSLINTNIFKVLSFNDELCFEHSFAQQYTHKGFKTAFLPGYHFKHIGRLTNDRSSLKCNAYDLLNSKQFFDIPRYKSFLINLKSRPDRLKRIKQSEHLLPADLIITKACDGYTLVKSPRLYSLCGKCDYYMRPGVIGCALSHIMIYYKLLFDKEVDGYIIFEDDVTPDQHFLAKLSRSFTILKNKNEAPDILFFTTTFKSANHKCNREGIVRKYNRSEIDQDSIGGAGCYYISKHAAQTVFDYIEKNTLDVAIDALLFNISNQVSTYFVQPPIISQVDNSASNVQHDHNIKSPLLCSNPIKDSKIVYNNLSESKNKIDLFNNIMIQCMDEKTGTSSIKSLEDSESHVYLRELSV